MNNRTIIQVGGVLTEWAEKKGVLKYERTCRSSTCCCASHDSGYHYVEREALPTSVLAYIDHKGRRVAGTPSSHGWTTLHRASTGRPTHTRKGWVADRCREVCGMAFLSEQERGEVCRAIVAEADEDYFGQRSTFHDAVVLNANRQAAWVAKEKARIMAIHKERRERGLVSVGSAIDYALNAV